MKRATEALEFAPIALYGQMTPDEPSWFDKRRQYASNNGAASRGKARRELT